MPHPIHAQVLIYLSIYFCVWRWHHTQQTWTTAEVVHLPLKWAKRKPETCKAALPHIPVLLHIGRKFSFFIYFSFSNHKLPYSFCRNYFPRANMAEAQSLSTPSYCTESRELAITPFGTLGITSFVFQPIDGLVFTSVPAMWFTRLYPTAAFLKLFSSGDHVYQAECSTDRPTRVPFKSKLFEILNYSVWYAIHINFIFSVFFWQMINLRGPQGQNPRTSCGSRTTVWETLPYDIQRLSTESHNCCQYYLVYRPDFRVPSREGNCRRLELLTFSFKHEWLVNNAYFMTSLFCVVNDKL
jgi:hypothetical protein